jgi:hypothetical protein
MLDRLLTRNQSMPANIGSSRSSAGAWAVEGNNRRNGTAVRGYVANSQISCVIKPDMRGDRISIKRIKSKATTTGVV